MKCKSVDFFELIGSYKHNIAVFLTYTLDTEVIEKLAEKSRGTILILHDQTQGVYLDDNRTSRIVCLPLKPPSHSKGNSKENCFHSKFALLKSDNGAVFIIGSANLSKYSFSKEKEIVLQKELHFEIPSDLYLYNKILAYLEHIAENNSFLLYGREVLNGTIDRMKIAATLNEKKSHIQFVYNNITTSIFDRVKDYLLQYKRNEKPLKIKIMTPYVSSEYDNLNAFSNMCSNISIYLRSGVKIDSFINCRYNIYIPKKQITEGFHRKIVVFEYSNYSIVYLGSANFTNQGFFRNLESCSNMECGLILRIEKNEMKDWFSNGIWKLLNKEDLKNYKEQPGNSVNSGINEKSFYCFAERKGNTTTTWFYNPDRFKITKLLKGPGLHLEKLGDEFYKTSELIAHDSKVTFYLNNEKKTIAVFNMEEYECAADLRGESILYPFNGINSVDPKVVDKIIDSSKLRVKETVSITITEPPKLEQYYKNVNRHIDYLKKRKYLSCYNMKQIVEIINGENDSRKLYFVLQLLKLYSNQNKERNNQIIEILKRRADEIFQTLGIDDSKKNNFLKKWLS